MKKNKTGIIAALVVIALLSIGAVVDYLAPVVCWNMASLRALTPNESKPAYVLGYFAPLDGGSAWYSVTNTTTGTNEFAGRILAFGGAKSWEIDRTSGRINTRQFGAFPGTNGAAGPRIEKLLEYSAANFLTAVIGTGDHYMTNTAYLRSNTSIDGEPGNWLTRNWISPIDTRFGMLAVLGDQWPNGYLDTNIVTFNIVATNITIKNIGLKAASTNQIGFPLTISNARFVDVDSVRIGLCGYAWGITFLADDISIRNCVINTTGGNTGTIYTDGIHGIGGSRFIIEGNNIETGDDLIALSSLGSIGFTDGLVQNNIVNGHRGHAIRMQQDREYSYAVWTNITFRGISGQAGIDANGGILIQNLSTNRYNPFRNITIADVKLRVGNLATQGGGTNYVGGNRAVYIDNAENLLLSNVSVTRTAFESFSIERSTNVVIENCFGEGAEWYFRNSTLRLDSLTNVVVRGGYFPTLTTSIVSNSSPITVVGCQGVKIDSVTTVGSNTNVGGILLSGTQSGTVNIVNSTLINPVGYGILSVINPTAIVVTGNNVIAATPASWQGGSPPTSSAISGNIGLSSLGVSEASQFNVMNTSSGTFLNGLDARANYEARWTSTNGVFFLAQDKINGGSKVVRFGAQPSSSANKPTAFMVSSDPGSFPIMQINGGSSLMDSHRWLYFLAAAADRVAGTPMMLLNTNGLHIKAGVSGSPQADSLFEVGSTTQGARPFPSMTTAQSLLITPASPGLALYDTNRNSPIVSTGVSTNSNRALLPVVFNQGDADATVEASSVVGGTVILATPTANRTITLPTLGVRTGDQIRFVRPATGAFTWAIGTAVTLPSATKSFAIVVYDGATWVQVEYGVLL